MSQAAPWTVSAALLPLCFAQVREDPRIDASLLAGTGGKANVVMVASGGDTATLIVAQGLASRLHLVDANPAQLALTRLKLEILRVVQPRDRPTILGHGPDLRGTRAEILARMLGSLSLSPDTLGPPDFVGIVGPDHAGRYEVLFDHLRRHLRPRRAEIEVLLAMDDPAAQSRMLRADGGLNEAVEMAFRSVMSLENLVALFGEGATRNPARDFPGHFTERAFRALATFPACTNPFLATLFLDEPATAGYPDWLSVPNPPRWPDISYSDTTMVAALRELPEGKADLVHLSNILDWLPPEEATLTLELAHRALRPGGMTVIRQLNSSLDIPSLTSRLYWDALLGDKLLARDRSFFYRRIHVGRRPFR